MFQRIYTSKEIKKALDCYDKVKSYRKAAQTCNISKSTIQRWYVSFHSLQIRKPILKRKAKKRSKRKYPNLQHELKSMFQDKTLTHLSLVSIQSKLNMIEKPSLSWIRICLKKCRISRRRFQSTKICSRSNDEMKELLLSFQQTLDGLQDSEIVPMDETGFSNIGNATYGYFPKGQQPDLVSLPKRQRYSLAMAILPDKIVAHKLHNKAFNSKAFYDFVKETLEIIPNNVKVLLMDNVAFHKTKKLKELVENKGLSLLFIPPYSPRCNPIEEVFSLLKRRFRSLLSIQDFTERVNASIQSLEQSSNFKGYYDHTRSWLRDSNSI